MATTKTKASKVEQADGVAKSNGTKCPVTREQFLAKAPAALTVSVNGVPMVAERREYSTGSFGWMLNGKTMIEVDGVPVKVQIGCNLTVVGSKEA